MSKELFDEFEKARKEIFDEEQAKLPVEDRAAWLAREMCLERDNGFACTKLKAHTGDHCAHAGLGYIVHRWK